MYVILYLLSTLYEINNARVRFGVKGFVVGVFALGCLTRFVAPGLFIPDFFTGEASLPVVGQGFSGLNRL